MKKIDFLLVGLALIFAISGCKKEEVESADYSNTYLVVNEGLWGSSNGSLSSYDKTSGSISNRIFATENGRPLGDLIQSAAVINGKVYMVANGSDKVEIADRNTFEQLGAITGIVSPRYMIGISASKAYVSCWGDNGTIKVVDLTSNSVQKSIAVGTGPERMIVKGDYVYVANSGGWGEDSVVSVINSSTDEVVASINVGTCPMDMVLDGSQDLWVLCKGVTLYDVDYNPIGHKASSLVKINTTNNTVESTSTLFEELHPEHLEVSSDKKMIYYGAGMTGFQGIYKVNAETGVLDTVAFINKAFYAFNVNPANGDIFTFDAVDYQSSGKMTVYSKDGSEGTTSTMGIIPNAILFE